jgi:hypothetical protein
MYRKSLTAFALISVVCVWFLVIGCDEDSNYDERTVVYVASINDNIPFLSDVLDQGDSVYTKDHSSYLIYDDFVAEDYVKVQFHNKPYNSVLNVDCGTSLGDFLVTDYTVEFINMTGGASPVAPIVGKTSILVPANTFVEGYILLVPFAAKLIPPLSDLVYTNNSIPAMANINFSGHEVQTDNVVEFSCGLTVNFADPLIVEDD